MEDSRKHWFHAVTFDRAHSAADEQLARELLLEWGNARGLRWVHAGDPLMETAELFFGAHAKVLVERDNYGQWSGYAMEFVVADPGTTTTDRPLVVRGQSRLKDSGGPPGASLRHREERYEP